MQATLALILLILFTMIPPQLAQAQMPVKTAMEDKLMVIGTGTILGVYYPAGGAVCRLMNKERKALGIRCSVEPTPGSIYNIEALQAAEVDFAIIQSDWQEHAYNGTGVFAQKGRYEKLRHVFALHNEAVTAVVLKSSKIQKFDDIKGHIVNIGQEGSGIRTTMDDVMKAKNWTKANFKSLSEFAPAQQAKALCSGNIDVMLIATGHPNGLLHEVSNMCEVRVLDIYDDVIKKFIAGNPQFSHAIIPGGMYSGIPNDVNTFGVKATVVTSSDVTDYMVYNMTKIIFDNITAFKSLHPILANIDPAKMATEGRTAPYHSGALKYYKEKGLVVEEAELPPQ